MHVAIARSTKLAGRLCPGVLASAVVTLASAGIARADPKASAAQSLFDDARRLVDAGRYTEACPELERSQKLDPALGTEFNLADCYEHTHRMASAYGLFVKVADEAGRAAQTDRASRARARAKELEARVSRLMIAAPEGTAGLVIARDGETLAASSWGQAVAVDAGAHSIAASAPGKKPWRTTVQTMDEGPTVTVTIPDLADAPPASQTTALPTAPSAPSIALSTQRENQPTAEPSSSPPGVGPESPARSERLGAQRTAAIVFAGVGVVGFVVGAVEGFISLQKHDDPAYAADHTSDGIRSDAITAGRVSNVGFAAGVVGLVGGVALWLTAPSASTSTPHARAGVRAERGAPSLVIEGSF